MMSWIYLLYLFAWSNGLDVGSSSEDCLEAKRAGRIACRKGFDSPKAFPESAEELEEVCRILEPALNCHKQVIESCETDEEDTEGRAIAHAISAMLLLCNQSTQLNKVIGENLPCYKNAVEQAMELCAEYSRRISNETVESEEEWRIISCKRVLLELHCLLSLIRKDCGVVAQETAEDFIFQVGYLTSYCPEDQVQQIYSEIKELEVFEAYKMILDSILQDE